MSMPSMARKGSFAFGQSDPRDLPSSLAIQTGSFPFPAPPPAAGPSSYGAFSTSSATAGSRRRADSVTQGAGGPGASIGVGGGPDGPSMTDRRPSVGGASALQISLPPGQTNNLALKTGTRPGGSQSIFQTAVALRARLLRIPNFAPYLAYTPSLQLAEDGSLTAVDHLWQCLRLGSSFVFLVNRVGETGVWDRALGRPWTKIDGEQMLWEPGEGAINWGANPLNDKARKRPLARVLGLLSTLKGAGFWEGDDLWNLADLYRDDTNALVKVLHTVSLLLDLLPDALDSPGSSGVLPSPGPGAFLPGQSPFGFAASQLNDALPGATSPFMTGVHAIPGAVTPGGAALLALGGPAFGGAPAAMGEAGNIVHEIMDTERKYVQELELLQGYQTAVVQNGLISQDTAHLIFSNLHKLLDFQRRFQISMETEAEKGSGANWRMGDWGKAFLKHEAEFDCYEAYCANYEDANALVQEITPSLIGTPEMGLVLEPTRELASFLIKPIQRITKYPLLLGSLVKATSPSDYAGYPSLVAGLACVKRITDKVNETSRAKQNAETVRELKARVDDWKGHDPDTFGLLVSDAVLVATKGEHDREYHVFLFEHMLLCCKNATEEKATKKAGKNAPKPRPTAGGSGFAKGSPRVPLLLKGRIYVSNLTHTEIRRRRDGGQGLQLYWRSQDMPEQSESLELHMRTEEDLQKWNTDVTRLMAAAAHNLQQRRSQTASGHAHSMSTGSFGGGGGGFFSVGSTPGSRQHPSGASGHQPYPSNQFDAISPRSQYSPYSPYPPSATPDQLNLSALGFQDEFDHYPQEGSDMPTRSVSQQPSTVGRRSAPPPSGDSSTSSTATVRSLSRTEDQGGGVMNDWRVQQQRPAMPAFPPSSSSVASRGPTHTSRISEGGSFVAGASPSVSGGRPVGGMLRHQPSASTLRRQQQQALAEEEADYGSVSQGALGGPRYAISTGINQHKSLGAPSASASSSAHTSPYRNRSASSPNVYHPAPSSSASSLRSGAGTPTWGIDAAQRPFYPMPTNNVGGGSANNYSSPADSAVPQQLAVLNIAAGSSKSSLSTSTGGEVDGKRGSGESNTTSVSEESQPYPTTPFGSGIADGRQGPTGIPISRQGSADSAGPVGKFPSAVAASYTSSGGSGAASMLRIHFDRPGGEGEVALLKISLPSDSSIDELRDKVAKKISRSVLEIGPDEMYLKYTDPDGDHVNLTTQEDWDVCVMDNDSQLIEVFAYRRSRA